MLALVSEKVSVWVSHTLRYHRSDLKPLPEWYVEGERRWDLLPRIHQMREAHERQLAYMASPRCYIDRAYARLLRRNLLEEFSRLCGETEITLSFDGRVLSIVLKEHTHEVIASGDCWVLQMSNNGYIASASWVITSVLGLVLPSLGAVSPAVE